MPDSRFTVTDDWLEKYRTPRGGWTVAQMRALGFRRGQFPSGWKRRVVGLVITDGQRVAFERGRLVYRSKTLEYWRQRGEDVGTVIRGEHV